MTIFIQTGFSLDELYHSSFSQDSKFNLSFSWVFNLIIEVLPNLNINLKYVIQYQHLQNFQTYPLKKRLNQSNFGLSNFHYCNRRISTQNNSKGDWLAIYLQLLNNNNKKKTLNTIKPR